MGLTGRYLQQAQQLLPRGAAWPRLPDGVLGRLLAALADTFDRAHVDAEALPDALHPSTAVEYLGRWEEVTGLPDSCSGSLRGNLVDRRADVLAKLMAQGGQTPAYYIQVAAEAGYTIDIHEYAPWDVATGAVNQSINDAQWAHVWAVLAPDVTVSWWAVGQSAVNEPLARWGNEALECRIRQLKPAHTTVVFIYADRESYLLLNDATPLLLNDGEPLLLNH